MAQGTRLTFTRRSLIAGAAVAPLSANLPGAVRLPRKVRVAILGLDGHYSDILSPLPQLPDVDVVAISDPDLQKAARIARGPRLASVKQYADYRQMLDREKLDIVAVCNNNGERAQVVIECAQRKLHVIAEKPLALSRAELKAVREAVERNGVQLSMLLPMRFSPSYLAVKKVVDSGAIGEVAQISAQKSYKAGDRPEWMRRRATYGGTIPWIGIHMVDLMRWSSGREFTETISFQSHIAFPELGDMENVTGSLFRLDNGGVALLRMDYLRPDTAPTHGDDRMRLAGTKGVVEYQAATGVTLLADGRKPEVITDLPPAGSEFIDFLEAVYNGKRQSLSVADVYRVTEIVIAAQEAAEERRIVRI